ncbi:MAG: aminopeptidase P family protein [Acidobacteriales bacterium]|nr:aminopeptidase P family protein [Candidatus Koribacter versatilis]MBI3646508.1 aminopeptidase P family protein [Terriglobales bacterium]
MDLSAIQKALRERSIDAWLFYDHHHRDPIAYRVLGLPDGLMVTRRWFYLIPAKGEPTKLVHKIEAGHLDTLPGTKCLYSGWQELFDSMKGLLASHRDIAMQYSPNNLVFTISLVDAGTVDLIRGLGKNVVSSQDLIAQFEATLNDAQIGTHFAARDIIDKVTAEAFQEIGRRVRNGGTQEHEIQQWFMEAFQRENMVTDDPPIVAVNANSGNPHYEPSAKHPVPIREGDFVLLDVWAKKNTPGAVYYDITWTGVVGKPSDRHREIFKIVSEGRDVGVKTVLDAVSAGRPIAGWEVDRAVRGHIRKAGYGEYFIHRTGHSIGTEVHANGANMDDLEIHDERRILPNSCFSIEPGIYLPEFGVRSEVNVLVRPDRAEVTGKIQHEIVTI